MDPRVFFRHNPSNASTSPASSSPLSASASSTDGTSDLSNCRYSSFYSTQCINNHCDTKKHQFRQCDNHPAEELITDEDGQQHWQPTNEAAARLTTGSGLTADVSWPDPVTGLFDELRAQTRLMGQAFREWEGADEEDKGGEEVDRMGEKRDVGAGGDGVDVSGLMGGVMSMLHGVSREFVDALFDRPAPRPSSPRQPVEDSGGDVDDDEL